jgi:outer membrane cobalamin receptor
MKRWIVIGVITIAVGPSAASAETPAVAGSSAAVTAPESVAVTGETKSAPVPHAMTVSRLAGVQTLPIGRLGSPLTARIRGSTSNQTLVLVDGRPVAGTALGTQDLSEIPIELVDHIEILRGGASALYGPNAIGGVINVITKRATYSGLPMSHVSYESASYSRQIYRLDFGSRQGPVDYVFFGDRQWESGFRDNSDASTYNIGGNAGISMGGAGKLLIDLASYHANAGIPGQLVPPVPTNQFNNRVEKLAATPNARQVTDTQYARTSYILPLPRESLMTVRLFGSQREAAVTDPDHTVSTDRHEQSKGGEAQFNLPWGLMVGGSFSHDREDNTDQIVSTHTYIRSVENWGFFAEETLKVDRLTVIPSGRFDHNSQGGDSQNPRVQTLFDALPWFRLSASAARAFRVATIDEIQASPTLRPEHGWVYDAGFEVHPASFSLRATYFRANVTDLIQTTTGAVSAPVVTATNIGTARRQGVEIAISHIVNSYFREAWNYTYLENQGIPQGFTNYVTLANSPKHTVNFVATVTPNARWKWDTTARYVSSRFSDANDPTGSAVGSMVLLDVRLAYAWRQMELYVGVNDVSDRRYQEISGFPLPGRTAYGGIQLRLWG